MYCTANQMSGSAIHFLLTLRMRMRMRIEYELGLDQNDLDDLDQNDVV